MKKLRILYINGCDTNDDSIEYLPNSLRWFEYYKYPWESLPEIFEPKRLVHLDLQYSLLCQLWIGIKHLPSLRILDLSFSFNLMRTPDFTGMPNLEYLNLEGCFSLEEVHHSLKCCGKLIQLNLYDCESLERFPYVNLKSLESLDIRFCSSLEKFPEILGRMKPELEIFVKSSGIRELPSSIIQHQDPLTDLLDLSPLKKLVALPSSICKLKGLVKLNVSYCSKLESLPEEIGGLENLEELDASYTLISRPPSSIVLLDKLKFLYFKNLKSEDRVFFVFPQVNEGLRSLEHLNLSYCNLIDGGLPEDIGCLSSLKELNLTGNNFEHLPGSIAQLGALQSLNLSDCEKLKESPGFMGMPNLETLNLSNCMNLEEVHHSLGFLQKLCILKLTNCKRLKTFPALCIDSLGYLDLEGCSSLEKFPEIHMLNSVTRDLKFPEIFGISMKVKSDIHMLNSVMRDLKFVCSLSHKILPVQHDISALDSLSLRVFTIEHGVNKIPSWFLYQGMDTSVSVNLHDNWYVRDNFLGFAVCYSGDLIKITVQLLPLYNDGMSWISWDLKLSDLPKCDTDSAIHFFLVPFASLWDTSKANGKTPNDYGLINLSFSGEMKKFGFRLLYIDEPELEEKRRSRYDDHSEHHDEASCSRYDDHSEHLVSGSFVFANLQQQV